MPILIPPPADGPRTPPTPIENVAAFPSEAMTLGLVEALARTRAEHPALKSARAHMDEQRGATQAACADRLPQVALTGDFTRTRNALGFENGTPSAQTTDPAFARSPLNTFTAQATLTQSIYHGGQTKHAIEAARLGEQEAALAFTTTELDILHATAKAYLAALDAQAQLEVSRAQREVSAQFRRDIQAKRQAQMATELDRLRAESEYLSIVSEHLKAESVWKRALESLNGHLGQDPKTPLALKDPGLPSIPPTASSEPRSELSQLETQEKRLRASEASTRAEQLPTLDFSVSYGIQSGQSAALFKVPSETWQVNLSLKIPIFDGLRTSGKAAQIRAQRQQTIQARIDKERTLSVEKASAERELVSAQSYLESAEKAYQAAQEALRTSRESFEQGLITSLDLLQAQRSERTLDSQRRSARYGLWTATFALRRANGLPPLP